jgi:hypothetical protein
MRAFSGKLAIYFAVAFVGFQALNCGAHAAREQILVDLQKSIENAAKQRKSAVVSDTEKALEDIAREAEALAKDVKREVQDARDRFNADVNDLICTAKDELSGAAVSKTISVEAGKRFAVAEMRFDESKTSILVIANLDEKTHKYDYSFMNPTTGENFEKSADKVRNALGMTLECIQKQVSSTPAVSVSEIEAKPLQFNSTDHPAPVVPKSSGGAF